MVVAAVTAQSATAMAFGAIAVIALAASLLGPRQPVRRDPERDCPHCLSCQDGPCPFAQKPGTRRSLPDLAPAACIDTAPRSGHVEQIENQPT